MKYGPEEQSEARESALLEYIREVAWKLIPKDMAQLADDEVDEMDFDDFLALIGEERFEQHEDEQYAKFLEEMDWDWYYSPV